jgi:proline iminopeptidase
LALATINQVNLSLYADQPLLREWTLATTDGHALHVREWGCGDGTPVLVLHGGPGSGAGPVLWRVFDPQRWRVIVPDQRGAGRSTPAGALHGNTTAHLLDDITLLRRHLGLAQWTVAGGSWGATLALLAAAREAHTVTALLLRAPFLADNAAIEAFFDGAPHSLQSLHAQLHGHDAAAAAHAAQAWWQWECVQSGMAAAATPDPAALLQRLRLQSHYLVHDCFLRHPLVAALPALHPLPITIVHGEQDRVCPPAGTHLLRQHLPHAQVHWVPGTGHNAAHPSMVSAWMHTLASSMACAT